MRKTADPLPSPYRHQQVWAVAPLRNESGTLHVDTARLADHLTRQLENASHIDVLPVNRVLEAMAAMGIREVTDRGQALELLGLVGADALVVGSLTSFDPYDPPKAGMALELYASPRIFYGDPVDLRNLSGAATEPDDLPRTRPSQPVTTVSGFLDAADPDVRRELEIYANKRGIRSANVPERHLYRINSDLYMEFVSYAMSSRLLRAESLRLSPPLPEAEGEPVAQHNTR